MDGSAARRFHDLSKYHRLPGDVENGVGIGVPPELVPAIWEQDRSIEPHPFKEYETLAPLPLPREWLRSPVDGLTALATPGFRAESAPADLAALARIALHANGLLNRSVPRRDGTVHQFRTAGGTGARYHLELYFICGDLPDLAAGVYHYAAHDHTFRQVRSGDYRSALVAATGEEPAVATAPVVMAVTSTFWRNAWRYRERAYRHACWDAGTVLSQVLGVAASAELSAKIVFGYADSQVNRVLDVDGEREATIALCALGGSGRSPVIEAPAEELDLSPLGLPTKPISSHEFTFEEIPRIHEASALASGQDAAEWRRGTLPRSVRASSGQLIPLAPARAGMTDLSSVEELILDRRSVRGYDDETATSFEDFSTLIRLPLNGFESDCLEAGVRLHELFLIVNAVEGLAPGLYRHHPEQDAVELLKEGDFRAEARRVALDQEYPGDAHVNCYYLTDLELVFAAYGDRGYRLAQLEPALYAGRTHLATHEFGYGAVGSTAYDDELVDLFSPHAGGLSYMFVTVFGKRRPRHVRSDYPNLTNNSDR